MSKGDHRLPASAIRLLVKTRHAWATLGLCVQLSMLATPARADSDTARDYHKAVKLALSELELGNYVEANAQFERAHRLNPSARTLRGLGIVAFELKRYPEAEQLLVQALDDPRRPLEGEMKSQTEELLARTRNYLGTLKLSGVPSSARLLIDDQQVPLKEDLSYRLPLGEHRLKASAEGHEPARRRFRIHSEQVTELQLDMPPLTATAAPAVDLTKTTDQYIEDQRDDGSVFESPWLWTAVGVVVAGATVGTIVALSSSDPGTASTYGGTTGAALEGP